MSNEVIQTIPEKIIVGLDKYNENTYGLVTFRYKGKFRCGKNLFHDHSEFPGGPQEFDNSPMEGFKIIARNRRIRTQYTYYKGDLVDIQDPRGFLSPIEIDNFIELIKTCDVVEGTLCGQYVYSWSNDGVINLLSTESDTYKKSIQISRKDFDRILKVDDMIPGSLYMFKSGGLYYNLRENIDNNTATFLGPVKLAKEFGKKYETAYLFTNTDTKTGKRFVFCGKLENINYELEKNYISEEEVKTIIEEFKKTAYSWDFWNPGKGNKGCVKKFIYLPTQEFPSTNREFKYPTVILDGILNKDNEFTYAKSYVEFKSLPPSMQTYRSIGRVGPFYYPAYKFSLVNGVPVPQRIVDLGKSAHGSRYYYSYATEKTIDDLYVYSTKEDRDKVRGTVLQEDHNPILGVIYETTDGKVSDSLQTILSVVQGTDISNPWRGNYGDLYYSRLELPEIK